MKYYIRKINTFGFAKLTTLFYLLFAIPLYIFVVIMIAINIHHGMDNLEMFIKPVITLVICGIFVFALSFVFAVVYNFVGRYGHGLRLDIDYIEGEDNNK